MPAKSVFGSGVVVAMLVAAASCSENGAARDDGTDAVDGSAQSCPTVTRPAPCTQDSGLCILDLRGQRSEFLTCRTGYAWMPYLVSCGPYDGVVYAGVDSETTYYFDQADGHLVGVTNTGSTTLMPCGAFDPSFGPTRCDAVEACPPMDAGADTSASS
jgi:hypothetical protein